MHLPFYSGPFPTTHVHMEHSDWLDSVKATSSGRFCYLSARRSRLASLLQNHSSKTVSILTYLPRLARHPRLLRHPLPDQRNFGLAASSDLTPGALTYVVVDVQVGALYPLSFASQFSSTHLSLGLKVGRDPLSFVVLFPVQLIPVD